VKSKIITMDCLDDSYDRVGGTGANATQEQTRHRSKEQRRYHVTDLGTLGGHNSVPQAINERGQVAGLSETPDTDPICHCPVFHAFRWTKGVMRDLGTWVGTRAKRVWAEPTPWATWPEMPRPYP
jgi:probable HAF family extracellular repeat protein